MVVWLRRLCGGWVRNAGNKAQLRPAGAGALPELGKKEILLITNRMCMKESIFLAGNAFIKQQQRQVLISTMGCT